MFGSVSTTLSDAVAGGIWSSSASAIASIGSLTGTVTSGSVGIAVITYSTGCGAAATVTVNVTSGPPAILGPTTICSGGLTMTLSDATTGGSWSSSNTFVATIDPSLGFLTSGLLPAGTFNTTVISYNTGCGAPATSTVTVTAQPPGITGNTTVCQAASITLSDVINGTWSSNNTNVAVIGSLTDFSLPAYPVAALFLTYDNGCGVPATAIISVTPLPGAITDYNSMCRRANNLKQ